MDSQDEDALHGINDFTLFAGTQHGSNTDPIRKIVELKPIDSKQALARSNIFKSDYSKSQIDTLVKP